MGLRWCDARHFVRTISQGLVTKVSNTDSNGRPKIVYKSLKDVYESENSIRPQNSGPDLVFDNTNLRVVDRTLQEVKSEPEEFVCLGGNGGSTKFDRHFHAGDIRAKELDDDTTLKQLRERLTKKRKRNDGKLLEDKAKEPVEDDLHEPLINLKSKRSKASNTKRKCKSTCVISSSNTDFNVKADKNLFPQDASLQSSGQFDQAVHVKSEILDTEQLECQTSAVDGSTGHFAGADPSGPVSIEYQNTDQHESRDQEQIYDDCVTNEVSGDLEDVEPISMFFPTNGKNANVETLESVCEDLQDLPPMAIANGKEIQEVHSCGSTVSQDADSGACINSDCLADESKISEQTCSNGIQVSGMSTETDSCQQDSFLSIPDTRCGPCPDLIVLLQTTESLISIEGASMNEEKPSLYAFDDTIKNDLNCEVHIENQLHKDEEKETSTSTISDTESQLCLENQICNNSETLSSSEHVSPERLLSTRKAMSPSSQERLCLVMNSMELGNDAGLYTVPDCKGKLFGKQTGNNASVVGTDIECNKSTDSLPGLEKASPQKVFISPRIMKKRSKITKGNLEGPHFSRALPNLSTGCTSIQVCSESAVAFSQRQMHDMESLAEKLMNELKSMKDIVEQKLLFESYRNASLKNDADGVKSAISSATKVEDTARKWLSVMSRDCVRFCKIMKMTPNSSKIAKDANPKEKKRIVFADEAGGKLCHVKFFGDDDFPCPDDVKQ